MACGPKSIFLDTAIQGVEFLKFGRRGRPHKRLVRYLLDEHALSFGARKLILDDSVRVESTSKVLQRQQSKNPLLCFSIVTEFRTLDLEAVSKEQKEEWEEGLRALLSKPRLAATGASAANKPLVDAFRASVADFLRTWQERSKMAREAQMSDRLLERFLIARNFDMSAAQAMLENAINWREREHIDAILDQPAPIFRDIRTACKYQLEHKYTKAGQPLHVEMIGKLEVDLLLDKFELPMLVRQRVHLMEFKQRMLLYGADTSTNIVDVKGLSPSMIKPKVYKFINALTNISQDYYPESLGQIFVIRAPTIFAVVWRVIRPWLNERTQTKIDIHRDLGLDSVLAKIPRANLPAFIGGGCVCVGGGGGGEGEKHGCEEASWMETMYLDVCDLGWEAMTRKWKNALTSGNIKDSDPQLRELLRTPAFQTTAAQKQS